MMIEPAFEAHPAKRVTILSVSPFVEDHSSLQRLISHSKWMMYDTDSVSSAMAILDQSEIGVVLCERDLPAGNWRNMLERTRYLPSAPSLIVTSRHADDSLWADALSCGAYDVLGKPFDQREVVRSVSLAWRHWLDARRNRPGAMSARMAS
jgi:DNA-binding NtrC family response regulator